MKKTALLVVDAQNEMFADSNPVYNANEMLENLKTLIEKARSADVPVVYVQHNDGGLVKGTHDWEIHPAISPKEGDPIIQKWSPDSFHETELQDKLKTNGIENLIITGNQTENCIDATCRRAFDLGYKVTLAKDAHGTWDSDTLSAKQIIDHHNEVLSNFADLKETRDIEFSE
ncbi:cysteine hydrolase family protein [Planococcus sp. N028]|uniref:Cysteine hydrolase family protein n=1 Tax=Planococcus shixiaomingii TaxID=3058393 RepID=A0ABT8MYK4_9BACL|nr:MULTISPECIES: cysteine hydrolase family protein [unclassified Planococcus (in: firmicutes)]MDN7240719.1 cysteine hydrolase family protein [Planococcus sp. N028]WKA56623.1 cysteine hydrolase family protein [Planococcus sp. N022]